MSEGRCEIARHSLLPLTQSVVMDLEPAEWQHCASFLTGLLQRAPLNNGANDATGWRAETWILGVLASELRLMAHEAGETADTTPRSFGSDPVGKARAQVAELAEIREANERERERRLGDAVMRDSRREAAELAAAADDLAELFS